MDANRKSFLRYLEGADKHFIIPVYQRNYDWKKEHCKQLFNDLITISQSENDATHFMGSIVSIYHRREEWIIIDGQQRITTLSLILLAIYNIIKEKLIDTEVNKDQIRNYYLINEFSTDEGKKLRLKPVKNDKEAFNQLFKDASRYILDSNITVNYHYFYKRILKKEVSIDSLFAAIKKLVIVAIELTADDNPQLIFESLNSTGLALSSADQIRNFVLMKESPETQERLYNDYWHIIEKNTNFNASDFIRDYLTIKERSIHNKTKVYSHFKNYVIMHNIKTEDLLADLLKFSEYYKYIIEANDRNNLISKEIAKLNKLKTIVAYPFLMELYEDCQNNILTENDMLKICKVTVDFVFRRTLCDVPTNALNTIFMALCRAIKKQKDYRENYFDIFVFELTNKKLSHRFPSDDEISDRLMHKNIYTLQSKNLLLEEIESYDKKERFDIEKLLREGTLSVEHIMPQKLTAKWIKSLGTEYDTIHEKYLHTLGNITLTAYNSKMSNKPFDEKRDMKDGFKESKLFLNDHLSKVDEWNEASIKRRADVLLERVKMIYPYPITQYKSEMETVKCCSLSDNYYNFIGEKIVSYKFSNDKEQMVEHWKQFYGLICKNFYELDPIRFKQIVFENKFEYRETSRTSTKEHIEITDFFIYAILDTETMLSRLRTITKEMEFDLDDVCFTIS